MTLDHKTRLKSLGYIYSNSQKYIVWVKMIDLCFMPKIISVTAFQSAAAIGNISEQIQGRVQTSMQAEIDANKCLSLFMFE